jgi:hypothetical protein
MGIGGSIVLIAIGAILRFAVRLRGHFAGVSVNWHVVGDILIVAGAVGVVVSLFIIATAARRGATVVDDRTGGPPVVS